MPPKPSSRGAAGAYGLVVVASRLPVDRVEGAGGEPEWRPSPGGLVTALEPVMREADGAWIGWTGAAEKAPDPFDLGGMHLVSVGLSAAEVRDYYEGFCNATLWPLYHDVIARPEFHRAWWDAYVEVNRRYARAAAEQAATGAIVWVHDYQLQLVPGMLRELRGDVRIGFFNHIPFPGYEIFAQLPWRRQIVQGLLGAELLGFQRPGDATNFLRAGRAQPAWRPGGRLSASWAPRTGPAEAREVRAAAFPISIDSAALGNTGSASRRPGPGAGDPANRWESPTSSCLVSTALTTRRAYCIACKAYGELLSEGKLGPPEAVLIQVASPSRERIGHYRALRDEVEVAVGRINGEHGELGRPPVHYLHQSYPKEEMAALFLAADVMLVTSLRDGMNLVAKEYVACRNDESGALVLSEFTGAADELRGAFIVNPHDVEGLKDAIMRAATVSPAEARRRIRSMRRRVHENDVAHWAASFLDALKQTPAEGQPPGPAAS